MPLFARDRPIYAGPRPRWKNRGGFRFSLFFAAGAILTAFGQAYSSRIDSSRHDPAAAHWHEIAAYIWLVIGVISTFQAYRAYRRRP